MKFPVTAQHTQRLLAATGWCPGQLRSEINRFLKRPKSYTTIYYYRDGKIRPDPDMLDILRERVPAENPLAGWVRDEMAGEYGEA
jgi:hypothetical protein